jgi:hypothetical protein
LHESVVTNSKAAHAQLLVNRVFEKDRCLCSGVGAADDETLHLMHDETWILIRRDACASLNASHCRDWLSRNGYCRSSIPPESASGLSRSAWGELWRQSHLAKPKCEASPFANGEKITLLYPVCTRMSHMRLWSQKPLTATVIQTRDLVAATLTPAEYLQNPLIPWSRWIVTGWDESRACLRQLYTGISQTFRSPCQLRVAFYQHGARRPDEIIYTAIEPNVRHRKALARLLKKPLPRSADGRVLRVYCDGLRLGAAT